MSNDREGRRGQGADGDPQRSAHTRAPGRRTLTEELPIHRKASGGPVTGSAPAAFDRATSSAGGEVPYRAKMEAAFGEDFSGVSAHLGGAETGAALGDLGARAAASSERIAFRESNPSESLVAHELTHVVQQRRGGSAVQAKGEVSEPGDAHEREADAAGEAVAAGRSIGPIGATAPAGIQRKEEGGAKKGGGFKVDVTADSIKLPRRKLKLGPYAELSGAFTIKFKDAGPKPNPEDASAWEEFRKVREAKLEGLEKPVDEQVGTVIQGLTKYEGEKDLVEDGAFPGLEIKLKGSAMETAIKTKGDDVGFDLKFLRVALEIKGKLGVIQLADGGSAEITADIDGSLELTPEGLQHFYKAVTSSKQVTAWVREAGQADKTIRLLTPDYKRAVKRYRAALAKGQTTAASRYLEVVKAREKLIVGMGDKLRTVTMRIGQMVPVIDEALAGLKSGYAKLAERVLRRKAAQVMGKVLSRLIPGIGWVLTVLDVVELGGRIFKLLEARSVHWGFDDEGEKGGEGEGGEGGGAEGGKGGEATGTPGGTAETAVTGGEATGAAGDELKESLPELTAAARKVLGILPPGASKGMTAVDIEVMNQMIPADLQDYEVLILITLFAAKGRPAGDNSNAIALIRREIDALRHKAKEEKEEKEKKEKGGGGVEGGTLDDKPDQPGSGGDSEVKGKGVEPGDDVGGGGDADGKKKKGEEPADPGTPSGGPDVPKLEPPPHPVPVSPRKLFKYDADLGKMVPDAQAMLNAKGPMRMADGLSVLLTDATLLSQQPDGAGGDGKPLSIFMEIQATAVILALPAYAATYSNYPYSVGQVWQGTFKFQYQVDTGKAKVLDDVSTDNTLHAAVYRDGTEWKWDRNPIATYAGATVRITHAMQVRDKLHITFIPLTSPNPPMVVRTVHGMRSLLKDAPITVEVLVPVGAGEG